VILLIHSKLDLVKPIAALLGLNFDLANVLVGKRSDFILSDSETGQHLPSLSTKRIGLQSNNTLVGAKRLFGGVFEVYSRYFV